MTDSYGPHTAAWGTLRKLAHDVERRSIADLFAASPDRFRKFSAEFDGLLLDFSRQRLDEDVLAALLDLARETDVPGWIERMFAGEPINSTENRAALHVALRRPADRPIRIGAEDVMPLVEAERTKMRRFANALQAGELRGATGRRIDRIVNIGIGGSDLGIGMAVQALAEEIESGLQVRCVSNVDGVALAHALSDADPETTLFVICSKTFTTLETLTNANVARDWLIEHIGAKAVAAQCIAVSTNQAAMDAFGIAPERRLVFWDWVGGRFSLWSSVGLTIALAVGADAFDEMLGGAYDMDEHFATAALDRNLPVLFALVGIWNRNFLGIPAHAVLPYDDHLARFPAYLQQLEMESNGKSVRRDGNPVECATCPVVFGEPGSNAQHSFFQLLHQGTDVISTDFVLPAKSVVGRQAQQDLAAANCLAQVWALAAGDAAVSGRTDPTAEPHRHYAGNRPSNLLLFRQVDPATLGKLIALYEHRVFVQGVVWDINSFDQFGVELGKRLASQLSEAVRLPGDGSAPIAGALAKLRSF
jgi:glucose-6-phosphate isomerase